MIFGKQNYLFILELFFYFKSDQKITTLFSISSINYLQAKVEKQMNLNMNIQTVLSKYPSKISDKASEIFNQPSDFPDCQNDFFEDIFDYVRMI